MSAEVYIPRSIQFYIYIYIHLNHRVPGIYNGSSIAEQVKCHYIFIDDASFDEVPTVVL